MNMSISHIRIWLWNIACLAQLGLKWSFSCRVKNYLSTCFPSSSIADGLIGPTVLFSKGRESYLPAEVQSLYSRCFGKMFLKSWFFNLHVSVFIDRFWSIYYLLVMSFAIISVSFSRSIHLPLVWWTISQSIDWLVNQIINLPTCQSKFRFIFSLSLSRVLASLSLSLSLSLSRSISLSRVLSLFRVFSLSSALSLSLSRSLSLLRSLSCSL